MLPITIAGDGAVELVLAAEMIGDRRDVDLGARGDVADGRAGQPALAEEVERRVEDSFARAFRRPSDSSQLLPSICSNIRMTSQRLFQTYV